MTKVLLTLSIGFNKRKQQFSPFSQEKKEEEKNLASSFHVVKFSAKYDNILEKGNFKKSCKEKFSDIFNYLCSSVMSFGF